MRGKQLLVRGIQAITFLFAMFSGFLTSVAPPEESNSKFAIGLCSFLALIVLLFISIFARKPQSKSHRKIWLGIAIASFLAAGTSALLYKWNLDRLTFPYPPENVKAEYVAGTELTPEAKAYRDENVGKTISDTVADFGGLASRELVWTRDSIRRANMVLFLNYTALVLSLAITIFCLTEGLLDPTRKKKAFRAGGTQRGA